MNKMKKILSTLLCLGILFSLVACGDRKEEGTTAASTTEEGNVNEEQATLLVMAAASLTDVCTELTLKYNITHPNVQLMFHFAGSGALQTQIEAGADADIFISAAQKQMNALKEQKLMKEDTIVDLLENKVVLIVPKDSTLGLTDFADVKKENVKLVGIGEVESVPAGQYAKEIFTNLGCWDEIEKKANFGTDVRTVLGWVETSNVDCGIVYATDAKSGENVKIVAEAPEGSCKPVIYPAGVIASSKNQKAAEEFLHFLKSDEAKQIFEKHGFSLAK